MKAFLVFGPLKTLEKAMDDEDWFRGIVLSATYFEAYGKFKIKEYLGKNKINIGKDKIERLRLNQVITIMYALKIIDEKTYQMMLKIKDKRDKLVHEKHEIYRIESDEGLKLIQKAYDIIKKLGGT